MAKSQSREYIFTRVRAFTIRVDGFTMKRMGKGGLCFLMENILAHGKIMLGMGKEN
jgi:hypothetical protein